MRIIEFYVKRTPWAESFELFGRDRFDGGVAIVQPMELKVIKADEGVLREDIRPMMSLDQASAQRLIDALWDAGLRPSEGTGSAGSLAATQKHLEDMRALVFRQSRSSFDERMREENDEAVRRMLSKKEEAP